MEIFSATTDFGISAGWLESPLHPPTQLLNNKLVNLKRSCISLCRGAKVSLETWRVLKRFVFVFVSVYVQVFLSYAWNRSLPPSFVFGGWVCRLPFLGQYIGNSHCWYCTSLFSTAGALVVITVQGVSTPLHPSIHHPVNILLRSLIKPYSLFPWCSMVFTSIQ